MSWVESLWSYSNKCYSLSKDEPPKHFLYKLIRNATARNNKTEQPGTIWFPQTLESCPPILGPLLLLSCNGKTAPIERGSLYKYYEGSLADLGTILSNITIENVDQTLNQSKTCPKDKRQNDSTIYSKTRSIMGKIYSMMDMYDPKTIIYRRS